MGIPDSLSCAVIPADEARGYVGVMDERHALPKTAVGAARARSSLGRLMLICGGTFAALAVARGADAQARLEDSPTITWATPRRVALDRTSAAAVTLRMASQATDILRQRALLVRARAEYALAADAWLAATQKDNAAEDARE